MQAKIGQLALENDFCPARSIAWAMRAQKMIDPRHGLPICRQAKLVSISRSNVYYLPRPVADADLAVMRRMDELHLNYPFAGARMLRDMLGREGIQIGRRQSGHLDAQDGHRAIYRKRNTQRPHPEHRIYPYLLKHLAIERPKPCLGDRLDLHPDEAGFVYLVAIVDWATRKVLAHRLSITMTPDFCVEALEEAIARYGAPEIFNTDQGSQFTSVDFTQVLKDHDIKISMDGRAAGSITSSSSGCGAASSTNTSICMPTRVLPTRVRSWPATFGSTTPSGRIPRGKRTPMRHTPESLAA